VLGDDVTKGNEASKTPRVDSLINAYDEFAKTLRTWLVAYGIGGPVLLLTNETVRQAIAKSGAARCIAGTFLLGVGLQVLLIP
jgi:hypothetical protein